MFRDMWHAECLPCGWLERYDTEDSAIRAAEDHVFAHHRDINPAVRGEQKMGHVQMRTVNDTSKDLPPKPAPTPTPTLAEYNKLTGRGAAAPAPASEVTLTTPKGETITVKE